jgi:hypothetical protein
LRAIEQGFQQSYPQFLGTASKGLEKQQLIGVFKKIYELQAVRIDDSIVSTHRPQVLNAKVA